ncbi:unnamed protein product [Caenorhabditis angaria]|uniref:Uncharacterized protein n=1 Tax=Caenorhabditis angaria TaxID=860376 RepID=A0A9P1MX44_9PELO|nr:unnamed protein product [Caenorhabditis angaria]
MIICWILVGLMIFRGMKMIGKISYANVILPYSLIIILFILGLTLDGASDGLSHFFLHPKFSQIFSFEIWSEALKQLCISFSIGYGSIISLSSYNYSKNKQQKSPNCFILSIIILTANIFLSISSGATVFSNLGFLAKQRKSSIFEIVENRKSLIFVAYLEVFGELDVSWIWVFILFLMMFLMGLSAEIALLETFCSNIYDKFPKMRRKKYIVVPIYIFLLSILGLIFSTSSGFYWFEIIDEYSSSIAIFSILSQTLVLMYIYGSKHIRQDIIDLLGVSSHFQLFFGANSPFWRFNWMFISPIIAIIGLLICMCQNGFSIFGWILVILPISIVPIFAIINFIRFKKVSKSALQLQKDHPSYDRIKGKLISKKVAEKSLPEASPKIIKAPEVLQKSRRKSEKKCTNLDRKMLKEIRIEIEEMKEDLENLADKIDDIQEELKCEPS